MQPGYYSVKRDGEVLPARWDGEQWNHVHGHDIDDVICDETGVPIPIRLSCQTGCTCTTNPDGTITIHCT